MGELQFQKDVDASRLLEEFKERGLIDKIEELRTKGDQVIVVTKNDLSAAEQIALESTISGHEKDSGFENELDAAKQKIILGIEILSELSVALRKKEPPQDQLKETVERFSDFQKFLYGGHLELAEESLSKIAVDDLVPQELIDQLVKKLQLKVDLVRAEITTLSAVKDG